VEILAALHPLSVPDELLEGPFYENIQKLQTSNWHSAEAPYTAFVRIGPDTNAASVVFLLQFLGVAVTKCQTIVRQSGYASIEIEFKSKGDAVRAITKLSGPDAIEYAESGVSTRPITCRR
jgi:hypothetical protein